MHRLERMRDQKALRVGNQPRQDLCVDGGRAGGDHHVGRSVLLDGLIDGPLLLSALRHCLEDEGVLLQSGRVVGDGDQGHGGLLVALRSQALGDQVIPVLLDGLPAPLQPPLRVSDDRAGQAVADDERGLAGTDGARSINRNSFHSCLLL